jgi:four helix bundle protein
MKNYKEIFLERLIVNTSIVCSIAHSLKFHPIAKHFINQLVRSSSATSLNYAESIDAESIRDLIHKLALVQKELRETKTNLQIISQLKISDKLFEQISTCIKQTDEHLAQMSQSLITLRARHRQHLIEKSSKDNS